MKNPLLLALAVACIPAVANAAPTGRQIDDSRMLATLRSETEGSNGKSTYKFTVAGYIEGDKASFNSQDAVRIDWKQKGKTLASQRCPITIDEAYVGFECTLEKPTLSAFGEVQAEVHYLDDRADKDELLTTLNLEVGRYYYWNGMDGNKPRHDIKYQIVGDDLLGSTFLYLDTGAGNLPRLVFYTWLMRDNDQRIANSVLRCSVDGKPLPVDIQVIVPTNLTTFAVTDRQYIKEPPSGETQYRWEKEELNSQIYLGPRTKAKYNEPEKMMYVTEHPGSWSCAWRTEGKTLREFLFTVAPGGAIKGAVDQQGFRLPPNHLFIETRFGKEAADVVFNPKAIKKSTLFGRPWGNPGALKAMFDALPPAKGASTPKPNKNAK